MPLTLYNKFNKSIVLCIQLRSLYCTKGNLDNATAKKHLNNFLDNRKEPGMMHSYSSFQQALNSYNLRRNSTHWRDMPRFCLMPKHQYLLAGMVAVFRKENHLRKVPIRAFKAWKGFITKQAYLTLLGVAGKVSCVHHVSWFITAILRETKDHNLQHFHWKLN